MMTSAACDLSAAAELGSGRSAAYRGCRAGQWPERMGLRGSGVRNSPAVARVGRVGSPSGPQERVR